MNTLDLLLLLCCSTACVRLIFYRRQGSTFKRGVSLIAWLAIVLTGSISLILMARGNVAQIIRMTRGLV